MYNPVNSIVAIIFGVLMIIAWLPTIFLTEINNKGNRLELNKLKQYLKSSDFKVTPTTITGTIISRYDITYNSTSIKLPDDVINKYIFLYYTSIVETTTRDKDGKNTTKTDSGPNGTTEITEITANGNRVDKKDLEYLARQKQIATKEMQITDTIKIIISYYGIENNAKVCELNSVSITELSKEEYDIEVYGYEYGETKDQAAQSIIENKDASNFVWKWLGRLGTFILLCGGLMALIAPIRDAVNAGITIPGIGFLFTPIKWLVGLYDVASFIIAIILTVLMTIFVYTLVNYPIISMALGGMIVGLTLYLKRHNA